MYLILSYLFFFTNQISILLEARILQKVECNSNLVALKRGIINN